MIHVFDSSRFGVVTFDSNNFIMRQNSYLRDKANSLGEDYYLFEKDGKTKTRCRVWIDKSTATAILESMEYVKDSCSLFNYDSFANAAKFVKGLVRLDGINICVAGVEFIAFTMTQYYARYSPTERKRHPAKVIVDDVVFL